MILYRIGKQEHVELTEKDFYPPEDHRALTSYIENVHCKTDYPNYKKQFNQYLDEFESGTGDYDVKTINDIYLYSRCQKWLWKNKLIYTV